MAKLNKNTVNKRCALPRKAKEQSVVNLERLAVLMEVIEAYFSLEDNIFKDGKA